MQEPPEQQRSGLGLPPLPLQVMLEHLPSQAKTRLLRSSRSVRDEVLMSAEALRFTPGAKSHGARSQQLVHVLQQRTEPLKLKLYMREGPRDEQMAAFLTGAAAASRPQVHGLQGGSRCCVEELTVQSVQDNAHGWGELLAAAFPRITSLSWLSDQLDVPVMRGLAACTRLTKLDLKNSQPTAALADSAPMLRAWLPHVRSLTCSSSAAGVALAQGLAAQLQHLELHWVARSEVVTPCLSSFVQLVSFKSRALQGLSQPLLEALAQLPKLKDVVVNGPVAVSSPVTARWSLESLDVGCLDLAQVACLPLTNKAKLTAAQLTCQLQPSPEASAAAMHSACSALVCVKELTLKSVCIQHTGQDGAAVVPPEECAEHLEAALGAMHPLAGKVSSLTLFLDWLTDTDETDPQDRSSQVGREVFSGAHAAFGGTLTELVISSACEDHYWAPTKGFWDALPGVLPQLRRLVLDSVSSMSFGASLALGRLCSKMVRAGRNIEIEFNNPLDAYEMREGLEVLHEFRPLVQVSVQEA